MASISHAMKKIKKALRLLAMVLFMILASFGLGLTGVILPGSRERYLNNEVKREQIDKSEEEGSRDKKIANTKPTSALATQVLFGYNPYS